MDARTIKSKTKIFDAFMDIRLKKEPSKITVKELCEKAHINKSTFYAHYEDIFDLSDKIESELVLDSLTNIQNLESIISDPCEFTRQIFNALNSNYDRLKIVFSGAQQASLADKVSKSLKKIIFKKYPELKRDQGFCVLLDYIIFGGYYAYEASHQSQLNLDAVVDILTKANGHMYKLLTDSFRD